MTSNTAPALYGLAKTAQVQALLKQQPAALRQGLEAALTHISDNPHPAHSRLSPFALRATPVYELMVETTSPKFVVVYVVDDKRERVTVVGLEPVWV